MDVTNSPSVIANNKLENGVAQLITAEAWNINSADLMKKALSPLVTVPAPSILTPPAESQSGVALKGPSAPVGQPQLLDHKPSSQTQEHVLPPVFQTPGFAAVLQDLFPTPGALATLLVPYPVIVPLPVPVPIPIPIPIPVPHSADSKANLDRPKPASSFVLHSCKGTQTPLEKEETKPFDFIHHRELPQLTRHTVIKMSSENEVLDLSMKTAPLLKRSEDSSQHSPEDGALDLSIASCRKTGSAELASTIWSGSMMDNTVHSGADKLSSGASLFVPSKSHEAPAKAESRVINNSSSELLRQQPKWLVDPTSIPCEPSAGNNIDIVSTSQTAKVIVSVKDAVPTIFCGKIKGLSGVSTKNFSFKRDMPQDSVLQCYDVKNQPEARDNAEALRKPIKNRSVKLKKMNSQDIHILPIKKQRLAAFFPRK
ncbi:UNVERIFIED_CONTAM: hypothetical protein K2H54_047563 [Gekko kuhli]